MAIRSIHKTLSLTAQITDTTGSPRWRCASRLLTLRGHQSDSATSTEPTESLDQRESLMVQKIEDAIHGIIVRRSAPDWLPFVPGSSYWVPPRRGSYGIANLVDKLANNLTEEEVMSLTTTRGWPSSAFFLVNNNNETSPAEDEEN